jgi:hypothetical protein
VLGWVLHAKRVLKLSELRKALVVQIGVPSLEDLDSLKPDATEVVRACGGLIYHNEDSILVTFSHESVRGFLQNNKDRKLTFPKRALENVFNVPPISAI